MISIITPFSKTHEPYLQEAYESIKEQTYRDFEWVLVPNGGGVVPDNIKAEPWVKIYDFPGQVLPDGRCRIGELKRFACQKAVGEIIAEFDADDMLMPTCLEKVAKGIDEGAVFVYSNNADFEDGTWKSRTFGPYYGWESRPFEYKGHQLIETLSFPPTAHAMRFIFWSPDHIRAWSAKAYWEIGGHDESMEMGDDHDLMCRFYIRFGSAGFRLFNEVLYLYRRHNKNNCVNYNHIVQKETIGNYLKYSRDMATRWAGDLGLMLLDLGEHRSSWGGYMAVDKYPPADIVADLNGTWPFPDDKVGVIRASHIFEHLKDPIHTMNEAYRVLAPGGWLFIDVPSTDGRGAFQDPTHCCYSQDTEVLTLNGWKLIEDTTEGEEVLTLNPETLLAEYQSVTQKQAYNFEGEMRHFKTDCMDLLVTPNHKMLSRPSGLGGKWKLKEAASFDGLSKKSSVFYQKVVLKTPANIPDTISIDDFSNGDGWSCKLSFPAIPFMKIVGWFISEGCLHIKNNTIGGKGNTYRIDIGQSPTANKEKYELIAQTIRDLGCKPIQTKRGISFCHKGLAYFFKTLGDAYSKHLPVWIKQQNAFLLEFLLETALLGDGSKNGTTSWTYASVSKTLADDISEIAQLCGLRATQSVEKRDYLRAINGSGKEPFCVDTHLVYISNHSNLYCESKKCKYSGRVVCLGVEKYHTLLVRRNGRAVWSGNSFFNENSFLYYTHRNWARWIRPMFRGKFQKSRCITWFPSEFERVNNIPIVQADLICLKEPYESHWIGEKDI